LAPVFTALLVTGRAGSAVTAEIGTMVVTEELDGLRMLSIDPVHFVVLPKAMALLFVMPILTAFFTLFGIAGAYVAGCVILGVDGGTFVTSLIDAIDFENDILGCLLKTVIFGSLLGLVATYRGYHCEPTSRGVSSATTGKGGLTLYATFDEIGGLKDRAPVLIAGVKVGLVEGISLSEDYRAKVQFDVDDTLMLPIDSSASIRTAGLLGDQFIHIELGAEDEVLVVGEEMAYTEDAMVIETLIGKLVHNLGIDKDK
jgi:hypothetical protein